MDCPSCHQPHASPYNGLLVESERALCTGCHEGIAGLASMPVQHEPFEDDPCTSCHVPHGSDYVPLLNNPQPNLCYRCHPSVAEAMSRVSHHPDECTRCHGVHAGNYENLLFAEGGNGFCYNCHPEVGLTYVKSKHRIIECLDCHNPHGGRFGALRRRSPTTLCSDCHPADEPHIRFTGNNNSHNSTPEYYDKYADTPLTCTSSCHNPHGTEYEFMMRGLPWDYDGTCLKCHVGVGIRF